MEPNKLGNSTQKEQHTKLSIKSGLDVEADNKEQQPCDQVLKGVEETDQLFLDNWKGDFAYLLHHIKFSAVVKLISLRGIAAKLRLLMKSLDEYGTAKLERLHLHDIACYGNSDLLALIKKYIAEIVEIVLLDDNVLQSTEYPTLEQQQQFWSDLGTTLIEASKLESIHLCLHKYISSTHQIDFLANLIEKCPNLRTVVVKPGHIYPTDKDKLNHLEKLVKEKRVNLHLQSSAIESMFKKEFPALFQSNHGEKKSKKTKTYQRCEVYMADYTEDKDVVNIKNVKLPRKYLQLKEVWKTLKTKGTGIKIALLDSGVQATHPQLRSKIKALKTFVPGELACIDDIGHGTHCAGILVGDKYRFPNPAYSSIHVGVAPDAELIVGKVINRNGRGEIASLCSAIEWAVEQQADVISLSIGSKNSNTKLLMAINNAINKGVVIVSSAANYGASESYPIGYPARYGNVICVGSHTKNGNPSAFTSIGREVDFSAPGENIWSTWNDGTFKSMSGTSFAAPFVSGIAALVLAVDKKQTERSCHDIADMRELLRMMCTTPGSHDQKLGYGSLKPMQLFQRLPQQSGGFASILLHFDPTEDNEDENKLESSSDSESDKIDERLAAYSQ